MTEVAIAVTMDKKYVVCTLEGKVLAGPFATSDEAVSERARIGFKPKVELGQTSIIESNTIGLEGYYVCIDNLPYVPVRKREDAECIVRAFELGQVALVHKRFLGGLGDLIVLSGCAVTMSRIHGKLVLTSWPRFKKDFAAIFVDYPEISLEVVLSMTGEFLKSDLAENLLLHNATTALVDTHLDQYERVYKQFGVPLEHRWSQCPIESACSRVEQIPVPEGEYAFIHDDPDRGYGIDKSRLPNMAVYNPSAALSDTILAFKDVLENAAEIHVIDSAFFHLAESLKPKGQLVFHRYSRLYNKRLNDYKTRYKWKVLV